MPLWLWLWHYFTQKLALPMPIICIQFRAQAASASRPESQAASFPSPACDLHCLCIIIGFASIATLYSLLPTPPSSLSKSAVCRSCPNCATVASSHCSRLSIRGAVELRLLLQGISLQRQREIEGKAVRSRGGCLPSSLSLSLWLSTFLNIYHVVGQAAKLATVQAQVGWQEGSSSG